MHIITEYKTTAKGEGRIVAKGGGKQFTMPYDHAESINANHGYAAARLVRRTGIVSDRQVKHPDSKSERQPDGRVIFTFPNL
jgi:hypothetical protein